MPWVFACLLAAACSGTQQAAAPGCDRGCWDAWETCKAACQKMVDPAGHVTGSQESCERICGAQRDTCDAGCVRGRQP